MKRFDLYGGWFCIVGTLSLVLVLLLSCSSPHPVPRLESSTPALGSLAAPPNSPTVTPNLVGSATALPSPSPWPAAASLPASGTKTGSVRPSPSPQTPLKSLWVSASWDDLPGFQDQAMPTLWGHLLTLCEQAQSVYQSFCQGLRPMSLSSPDEQRIWLMGHLQPYRVQSLEGDSVGLLTSYYEPIFNAALSPSETFKYPLYAPPMGWTPGNKPSQPWLSRKDIESPRGGGVVPELKGREIAWLADPLDVMVIHVQGSARLRVHQASGELQQFRVSFAASNEQPYQSMARWMLDQGLTRDASWSGLRASLKANPERAQEAFWSNPRYIFFHIAPWSLDLGADSPGPKGAWGVPLQPMSSVAVDPLSVPLGSALWLSAPTSRPALNRLVLAQDTGGAINGAVRADLFAGSGDAAGEWANQIKHPLRLWVLWPR